MNGELTWKELLDRVPIGGRRPDATLKRLRRARLLPKPTPKSLGRGRGVAQLYPAWAEERLRRVAALRSRGVRSERELRWWLWFEGGDDLWPPVQHDLLAAYPRGEQAALDDLRAHDPEAYEDAKDHAATELAAAWSSDRQPGFDRRRVHTTTEAQDLAMAAIEIAVPGDKPDFAAPLDDGSTVTEGDLVDRAWGEGAAETAGRLVTVEVGHPEAWEEVLSTATSDQARNVAGLIGRAFSAERVIAEARRFGADWADRALLIAASLYALRQGVGPPPS